MTLFLISLFAFSCAALISAVLVLICARKETYLAKWEKLPRAKYAGIILASLVLFWCIPNIRPILEPGSALQEWLVWLAVLAVVLCSMFLDYLFARAFAAFLILAAHYFLKESFALNLYPWTAFLAVLLFVLGIAGILIGAKPYWFRDWIRMLFRKPVIRLTSAIFFVLTALAGYTVLLIQFIQAKVS